MRLPRRRGLRLRSSGAAKSDDFRFQVDSCDADGITGWVLHPSGIEAVRPVAPANGTVTTVERPDVAATLPHLAGALQSGFSIQFASPLRHLQTVTIRFVATDGSTAEVKRPVWPRTASTAGGSPASEAVASAVPSLPLDVVEALCELRPDRYPLSGVGWDDDTIDSAVADIVDILSSRAKVGPVVRYAHYLHTLSHCFAYVLSHFDRVNPTPSASAIDTTTIGTSPEELLCISSHLYVLRSAGLTGGLVECGCYKGFSTCCLSHACEWLSIPMYVFDSFAGLPETDSPYYSAGEFCGTRAEVSNNLRLFGRPEVVSFYEGYFADTVPNFTDPVLAIWMDVDLKSSAADVMRLLPRLSPRSCVFSHELPALAFIDDQPQPDTSLVLPPILDAFRARGSEPVGSHMVSYLGAIWADGVGTPVLSYPRLASIVAAARASASSAGRP